MPITVTNPFKGRQYPGDVILQAAHGGICDIRWHMSMSPSDWQSGALEVDASCVWRWVQVYSPELNKRCQAHLKCTNKSYRVDETYIKVKGQDKYLYRAVDSTGQTIDFLLTAKHDTAAAQRFFEKVFSSSSNPIPRVINVDKNPAYPAAVAEICDRLCRTRVVSQRQLPTDHDYAVSTREYQLDQSSPLPASAAADPVLVRKKRPAQLDRSLHIISGLPVTRSGSRSLVTESCSALGQRTCLLGQRMWVAPRLSKPRLCVSNYGTLVPCQGARETSSQD